MSDNDLHVLNSKDVLEAWRQGPRITYKKESHVYGIDYNQQSIIVKFLPFAEAQRQVINANLAKIVGMNVVPIYAVSIQSEDLPFEIGADKSICDGLLVSPKVSGRSFDTFSHDELDVLLEDNPEHRRSMIHDLMAATLLNNHDASNTNGFYNEKTKEVTWIDPEMGLATQAEKSPQTIVRLYIGVNRDVSHQFPDIMDNPADAEQAIMASENIRIKAHAAMMLYGENVTMTKYLEKIIKRSNKLDVYLKGNSAAGC